MKFRIKRVPIEQEHNVSRLLSPLHVNLITGNGDGTVDLEGNLSVDQIESLLAAHIKYALASLQGLPRLRVEALQ